MTVSDDDIDACLTSSDVLRDDSGTFFFVLVDECHWGIGYDSVMRSWICDSRLRQQENIKFLFVSATPFNVMTFHSRY